MSRLHAARVAARLRRELGIEVEMIHGSYGEYRVLVDGEAVVNAGALSTLGILPSGKKILAAVRERLGRTG